MFIKFNIGNLKSINDNIKKLVVLRRDADAKQQQVINNILTVLYSAKWDLLKKLYN